MWPGAQSLDCSVWETMAQVKAPRASEQAVTVSSRVQGEFEGKKESLVQFRNFLAMQELPTHFYEILYITPLPSD